MPGPSFFEQDPPKANLDYSFFNRKYSILSGGFKLFGEIVINDVHADLFGTLF
jgi:hypothetical protein